VSVRSRGGAEHRVEPGRSNHSRAHRIEFGILPRLAIIRSLELRRPTPLDFCPDRGKPGSELLLLSHHRAAAILISSDFDWG
jgi:hypothetical protein